MRTKPLLILLFPVVLLSCKGPQGEPGPQGAKGETGTQGPAGAQGNTGAAGPAGPQGNTGAAGTPGLQGPAGPQGDSGPQGPQGPAGPQGATGAQGPAGTANVIYSEWINWTTGWTRVTNQLWASPDFPVASLTEAVLDNALIMVYSRASAGEAFAIPENITGFDVGYSIGKINFYRVWPNLTGSTAPTTFSINDVLAGVNQFRYIIIPGAVKARQAAVDYKDYAAVKRAYAIPD